MSTEKTTQSVPQEHVSLAEDTKQVLNEENGGVVEESTVATDVVQEEVKPEPTIPKKRTKKAVDKPTEVEAPVSEESGESEGLDFSDEDAELAANSPELDLGEQSEDEEDSPTVVPDKEFSMAGKSKDELLNAFAEMLSGKPVQSLRRDAEAIKVAFYKIHRVEVEQLRKTFIDNGGVAEEFVPPTDNAEQRLKDMFGEYRKRRDEFIATIERSKEDNLAIKLKIIEDLKELINGSETLNNTFNAFRELQQRWRDAGSVPQTNVKDLWDTYNHHVENFYSYIKIDKELRDLDLKKNSEAKSALCEEAEALMIEPSIINAFHKLQKLHEQWREIGPVSNEYKETLWERFREASSRINKQHQEYFEGLKDEQKRNFDLKTELCVKTDELAGGMCTTRKEWNRASEQLLEIQKVWKTIGFAPKRDNAKIYERFRDACDKFFEQKRMFYVQTKTEMDHNLGLKNEICEAAEALKDSEDWKKTTDELIVLQKRWKEIGPVARRHSDAVWKRFRAACDYFFSRKSGHFSTKDTEYESNLALKRELMVEIEAADIINGGFDMIKEFQRRWSEVGFVPIKQKDAIQKAYKEVMDKVFMTLRSSGQSRQMDHFRNKIESLKGSGDKRLRFERDRLYNKVKQLESDIALLENNIGFFSKSKNAESMIRDVREKIERAKTEMTEMIEKINLIDNQQE